MEAEVVLTLGVKIFCVIPCTQKYTLQLPRRKRIKSVRKTFFIVRNLDFLIVSLYEPPLEGKANRAVIEALATYFKTKRSNVILVSGEKSKNKVFEIIERL